MTTRPGTGTFSRSVTVHVPSANSAWTTSISRSLCLRRVRTARFPRTANPSGEGTGLTQEVSFLVLAVIGGSLLSGGYGSPIGAAIAALLYAAAREGIVLSGWDVRWFQALLGVLLLVALLANGVVRSRLKAAPRS